MKRFKLILAVAATMAAIMASPRHPRWRRQKTAFSTTVSYSSIAKTSTSTGSVTTTSSSTGTASGTSSRNPRAGT